jgi:hypothetical protein
MVSLHGKKTAFVLLVALILVMSIGGVFTANMMMEDGTMHGCPYMGVAALCDMGVLAHISQWQQMFTATVQHVATTALLLLLALALGWHVPRALAIPERAGTFVPRQKSRARVFHPLQLAFARGIIHSKAF